MIGQSGKGCQSKKRPVPSSLWLGLPSNVNAEVVVIQGLCSIELRLDEDGLVDRGDILRGRKRRLWEFGAINNSVCGWLTPAVGTS